MKQSARALGLLVAGAFGCQPQGGRDAVPPSQDMTVDAGAPARSPEGYDYVARRPRAVVALAEARGIAPDVARAAVDRLADSLGPCAREKSSSGDPPSGAARVVAQIGLDGAVTAANVRLDPGQGAAEIALLCLVAPIKLFAFASVDGGARGFAIEALWGASPGGQ